MPYQKKHHNLIILVLLIFADKHEFKRDIVIITAYQLLFVIPSFRK